MCRAARSIHARRFAVARVGPAGANARRAASATTTMAACARDGDSPPPPPPPPRDLIEKSSSPRVVSACRAPAARDTTPGARAGATHSNAPPSAATRDAETRVVPKRHPNAYASSVVAGATSPTSLRRASLDPSPSPFASASGSFAARLSAVVSSRNTVRWTTNALPPPSADAASARPDIPDVPDVPDVPMPIPNVPTPREETAATATRDDGVESATSVRAAALVPASASVRLRPTGTISTRAAPRGGVSHLKSAEETPPPARSPAGAWSNAHPKGGAEGSPSTAKWTPRKYAGTPGAACGAKAASVRGGTMKLTMAYSAEASSVQSTPPLLLTASAANPSTRDRGANEQRTVTASAYDRAWGSWSSNRHRDASRVREQCSHLGPARQGGGGGG